MCSISASVISLEDVPRVKTKQGTLRKETSTLRQLFPNLVSVPGVATGTVPGSTLKSGQRGCAMAHRELWSALQHKPGPHLVFEDDAKARSEEGLCGKLQDLQKSMEKEKLDLINIGPCFWNGNRKNGAPCTAAYFISQTGAEIAYKHTNSFDQPIDSHLVELCMSGRLRCDVVDLFEQAGGYSYVNNSV